MARRKPEAPAPTLFPFLSVLAAVMGTLILIIAGMSQIALANPKQRVEIDPFDPAKKSPVYVECGARGLLIYPDDPRSGAPTFVDRAAIAAGDSAWTDLTTRVRYDARRYILLLVRPDGVVAFREARATVSDLGIDLGYEPLFGTGQVRFHRRAPRP